MRHAFALCTVLSVAACAGPPQAPLPEVTAFYLVALPENPGDEKWEKVPAYRAELLLQDLVEPRQLVVTTPLVEVQAVHDGSRIAFRLTWADEAQDDLPGAARFSDACAIQFPAAPDADLPAPQMGGAERLVEITYWRASWQAVLDGRPHEITILYPYAHPDHYPFTAPSLEPGSPQQQGLEQLYAPAQALGNRMEGPRQRAVEDLIASGPGTLRPAERQISSGQGRRHSQGWQVQLVRPLPAGVAPPGRGAVAFAVWDGAHQEVGARKMRTGWTPLNLRQEGW
jgi:hypothetical protein